MTSTLNFELVGSHQSDRVIEQGQVTAWLDWVTQEASIHSERPAFSFVRSHF